MSPPDALIRLIAAESASYAMPSVEAVAAAARRRHGPGIVAVLFYGSCLRDRDDTGKIADLYLLAESYARVHGRRVMRLLNQLLPPNVYYVETPFAERTVRAKYAILSLDQFEELVRPRTLQSYFWARFAQPTGILWARDPTTRARVVDGLATAVLTAARETRPLFSGAPDSAALWQRAFVEAYRTELRAEAPERGAMLYSAFADRYDRLTAAINATLGDEAPSPDSCRQAERRWWQRRVLGKTLSILRLLRNAFTFEDGAAYVAWKIERHSGVKVDLTPWQRRHPILASTTLFWRLYRAGGFR